MKKICFILVLCHSFIALAQTPTFTWSEGNSSIENELNYSIQNYFDGKRIFNVRSIYNDKIFNKDVFVDIFSSNDDFEKDEVDRLKALQNGFLREFEMTKEEYEQHIGEFGGTIEEFYFYCLKIFDRSGKQPEKRGRPKKSI